jgi:hypothetical protein
MPHCLQYLAVSVCGYAALGDNVPASIVLGFDSAPIWVTLLANLMVLIHMVPAYQVRGQATRLAGAWVCCSGNICRISQTVANA